MKYLIFCFFYSITFYSQYDEPITLYKQFNGKYGYKIIGHTQNESDNWFQNPPPPCQMLTQTSDNLNLLPTQQIVAAYLYWNGIGNGILNPNPQLNGISVLPDINFVANLLSVDFPPLFYFANFKDVTLEIQSLGNITYTFTNFDLNSIIEQYCSNSIYYSGWNILLIYEDLTLPTTNLNIYHGLKYFGYNELNTIEIPINNLNITDNQNANFTYIALNGSPNLFLNESINFNGNILSNNLNPPDNPFNGTNSFSSSIQNWNQDVDTFDISSYINIGDTQANLTLNSIFIRFLQTVVTSIRSELPDATVQLSQITGQETCDNRNLLVNYTVANTNSNAVLQSNVPVSFYANNTLLQTVNTTSSIPIGGGLNLQTTLTIPTTIPNTFDLKVVVDNNSSNASTIAESNENNNESFQSITLVGSNINATFNLQNTFCQNATVPLLSTISDNGILGTWLPNVIDNQNSGTYVFTPNVGQCVLPFTLNVSITNSINPNFSIQNTYCVGANVPFLPTTSNNNISGTWLPNQIDNQNNGNYIFTPNIGQCANSFNLNVSVLPDIIPTFNLQNTFCQGENIPILPTISSNGISGTWSPNAINNQNNGNYIFTPNIGQCANSFNLNVSVFPNIIPTFNLQNIFCQGENVPILPTISDNGISGTWFPNAINNLNNGNYIFTPNVGQCANSFNLNVSILPNINSTFNLQNSFCQGETFPILPTVSGNGISGSWFPNAINNQNNGNYLFTPNVGQCANSFNLNVSILPNINPTFNLQNSFCQGDTVPILPIVSGNSISGSWSPNVIDNQNSGNYVFTPDTGQCANSFILNVSVSTNVNPTFNLQNSFCQGETVPILPTVSDNGVVGTWSPDVIDNQNSNSYIFTPNVGICPNSFTLDVSIKIQSTVTQDLPLCIDENGNPIESTILNSDLYQNGYTFLWKKDNNFINYNTASISVTSEGIYQLIASDISFGCQLNFIFNVKNLQPLTANYSVSNDFDLNQTIAVDAIGGEPPYFYSFNNLPFQENSIFNVNDWGEILVKTKDNSGCYEISKTINIWQFPRFFTPNGDGFNDTWSIKTNKKIKIDIFDRFGKLVNQLQSNEKWDGTFNSQLLPANDYWFVIYYGNKMFRGHFSLKR